jgi:hypothetical protein
VYCSCVTANNVAFGELVRGARGLATQDEIDNRGGPPRQRQTCIERGDAIDLSPAVLAQLDKAFGWPPQTSAALLSDPRRPASVVVNHVSPDALGVDAAGNEISMPAVVAAASFTAAVPLVQRWTGPVVIDESVAGAHDWLAGASADSQRELYRVGVDQPATGEAIAIDPIGMLRRFSHALTLASTVTTGQCDGRPPRADLYHQALTMLFIASRAASTGVSGLEALQEFRLGDSVELAPQWQSFLRASGLSGRYRRPYEELPELFDGLFELRDRHIDVELKQSTDGSLVLETVSSPRMVDAHALGDNVIVVYDASVDIDVAAVVDWAYSCQPSAPLLVVDRIRWESRPPRLPRHGRLIMIDPEVPRTRSDDTPDQHQRALTRHRVRCVAELVEFPQPAAGSAVLLPAAEPDGSCDPAARVWLGAPRITSNHDMAHTSMEAVTFFHQQRSHFGNFVAARLHPVNHVDSPAPLALVDDQGDELQMWGLACGFNGSGPDSMAKILAEAGFGSLSDMQDLTYQEERTDWPLILEKKPPTT